jgi:hypothetical protein
MAGAQISTTKRQGSYMPHRNTKSRHFMAAIALTVLASLALAACGGSSSSTTTNASANAASGASGANGASGAPGRVGARFSALRECLAKNGITLPKRTPGSGPRPGAGPTGGGAFGIKGTGPTLPKGVTRAQYEAALKKCGGGFAGRTGGFNSPARTAALTKFASCMRSNGIDLPAPNTSGSGPIFNTKSLNTATTAFRTAEAKCASDLTAAFRRGPTGGQAGPG